MRHINIKQFYAVILRRVVPEIVKEGGLWDTSFEIYAPLGARPNQQRHSWTFKGGSRIAFSTLQYESSIQDWHGAQVPLICFDQLEEFSWRQFSWMQKANRSMSGIRPYMRATCNPDPESFLRWFLEWWIDDETGLPIEERGGVVRWYTTNDNDEVVWGDTPEQVKEQCDNEPISLTFIPSRLDDNQILLEKDPGYRKRLMAMTYVDRERLLGGNWNIRPTAGLYFRRDMFDVLDAAPSDLMQVRYWDRAGTAPNVNNKDPDWTVGCKMGKDTHDPPGFWILDVARDRREPAGVERLIKSITTQDQNGTSVCCLLEQDPGQAGKSEAQYLARQLAGLPVQIVPKRINKITAAKPFSSQAEVGNVKLVKGDWNAPFLRVLEGFPTGPHDDDVDAGSGALTYLTNVTRWLPA